MYQKMEIQDLQKLGLKEVKAYRKRLEGRKTELAQLKAKGGDAWNHELQDELDGLVLDLVDVQNLLKKKTASEKQAAPAAPAAPKTEADMLVRLKIVRGRRFNPATGQEESEPYVQTFTFAEWQLFKKNFRSLGYAIVEVLNDPYGDATGLKK